MALYQETIDNHDSSCKLRLNQTVYLYMLNTKYFQNFFVININYFILDDYCMLQAEHTAYVSKYLLEDL